MKLTIDRVAAALELPVTTVERWIQQGRIPLQRSGTEVRFSRPALERWATVHNLTFTLNAAPTDDSAPEPLDALVPSMQRGGVFHGIRGRDAATALASVVDRLDFLPETVRDELVEKLIAREALASTGIGNGIAIPHPREPLATPPDKAVIATGFAEQPVPFKAIDDRPVFVFFVLISPTVKHHLHLLSRLSFCIRDPRFVDFLRQRPEAQGLFAHVAEFERQLDGLAP